MSQGDACAMLYFANLPDTLWLGKDLFQDDEPTEITILSVTYSTLMFVSNLI